MKKLEIQTTTFLLVDSFGNTATTTVNDLSDSTYIDGLKDTNGNRLNFESDAYHIDSWSDTNGINVKKIVRTYDFETLWNQTT